MLKREIAPLLGVERGVTALIGGGGKTTLMETLAAELGRQGTVILTTSTHIRRPDDMPVLDGSDRDGLRRALTGGVPVCVGCPAEDGKLKAPMISFAGLAELADYVIVEADGSRGLPLKAHAPHEPVIPPETARTVLVVGAAGFGGSIGAVCHRPERYAALAGAAQGDPATPETEAAVIRAEGLGDIIYVNQVENEARRIAVWELARRLDRPVIAGSLHRGEYECLF